jgi:hypothetical protein
MGTLGTFPFGQPAEALVQQDREPKKVFVLGVYASAVHARWIGADERDRVKALAVASEAEDCCREAAHRDREATCRNG